MPGQVPLVWPFGGLSDDLARSAQEPLTTPDASNVRTVEAETGRARGGTREGSERITTLDGRVRQIAVAQFDNRAATFTQYPVSQEVTEWANESPLRQDVRAIGYDAANNVYIIDGRAGVAKYNSDGKLVWKFVLPVESTEHIVRALVVADDGTFYVGVSEGEPQTTAKVWKFLAAFDGVSVPNAEWTINLEAYCEKLCLRDGALFVAVNDVANKKSEIRCYRLIDTSVPELAWTRTQVPHPINDMDVRQADGAIVTCHERNTRRYFLPKSPDTQKIIIDWDPTRLTSYQERVWCVLDASQIDGPLSDNSAYETGDRVNTWTDSSGKGRNAYEPSLILGAAIANCTAPTLNKSGTWAGQDTVLFSNATIGIGNAHNGMLSAGNPAIVSGVGDAQRTLLPCYTDAWFLVVAVVRTSDVAQSRSLLGQIYPGPINRALCVNTDTNGAFGLNVDQAGFAAMVQTASGAAENGPYAAFDATNGFCVIAITCKSDGSATPADLCDVNGTDCTNETYTGRDISSTTSTQLGRFATAISGATPALTGVDPFDGELALLMVFRDYVDTNGTKQIVSTSEFEKIVGYAHWRFGIEHKLPSGHTYRNQPPTADALPGTTDSPYLYLSDSEQMLVKWDPNGGRPRAIARDDSSSTGVGGIGYGCIFPKDGSLNAIYSMGPVGQGTGGTAAQQRTNASAVRRIRDDGDTLGVTGSDTWESRWLGGTSPGYAYPRMAVSGLVPNAEDGDTSGPAVFVPTYISPGTLQSAAYVYLVSGTGNAGTNVNTAPFRAIVLSTGAQGYACAVERELPEYTPGAVSSLYDRFLSIGTPKEGSGDQETVWRIRLVRETLANEDPTDDYVLVGAGTGLRHLTSGGAAFPPSGVSALQGLPYVAIVDAFQRFWIVDNGTYQEIDPRLGDGVGKAWESASAGALPKGCKLLAACFDRMILARGDDPELVFMTAVGDPHDCDAFPPEPSGAEAVAFHVGEPVNCVFALTEDLAIVGTPNKIRQITGDPAQNGSLDLVGDIEGLAFGEPVCKDPQGRCYVFGARGGAGLIGPSGIQSLSSNTIRRRLEDIDQDSYFIRLVWNWRQDGFHVFLIPQGTSTATTSTAYFWSRKNGRWWQDEYPFVITSARLVSNHVYVGCQDGRLLKLNEDVDTDDDEPMFWHVVGGPIRSKELNGAILVRRPRFTLGAGSVTVSLLASGSAEMPTIAESEWDLTEHLTDAAPISARGTNVWWKLSGMGRMAYEDGMALTEEAGMRRLMA